jgi:hypothetical protein
MVKEVEMMFEIRRKYQSWNSAEVRRIRRGAREGLRKLKRLKVIKETWTLSSIEVDSDG